MPKLFLGVLAVAWIVVLVPPILRARNASRSRGDSIGDFQNRLGTLSHSQSRRARRTVSGSYDSRPVVAPPAMAPVRLNTRAPRSSLGRPLAGPVEAPRSRRAERSSRRRREVVTVLFTATMLSAAVASALGGSVLWAIQILIDLMFVSYVVGMVWFRGAAADRMRTVSYLQPVRPRPVPAYALRRTGSS